MYSVYILSENYKKTVIIYFAFVLFDRSYSWNYLFILGKWLLCN